MPPTHGGAGTAVAVYLAMWKAFNAQSRLDPAKASTAPFDKYLVGVAKVKVDSALKAEPGIAYRGTPPTERVSVVSSKLTGSLPKVVLSDCPAFSTSDPWRAYDIKTGKAVRLKPVKVPAPYTTTVTMFQPNRKHWVVANFVTDFTRTCSR